MMINISKLIYLVIYYGFAQFVPINPFPFSKFGFFVRAILCKKLFISCGVNITCRSKCYFGSGNRLIVGNNANLGINSRILGKISIGDNVLMGPDVVIMAVSHEYSNINIPIKYQGEAKEREIIIGNNVWLGTRVIILPGVTIGDNTIVGAGSVVTKSFPSNCVIGGNPARLIKYRI